MTSVELALLDRVVPMLDAPAQVEDGVEEAGHVACGVDVGDARLQMSVDHHAVVHDDATAAQEVDVRTYADAEAGPAVAPLARCSVPGHLVQLSQNEGLPPLAELEVVLARSSRSARPPCDFLAEQILVELRT